MSDAWQRRETEHAAELDRVKRKAFIQGQEEGLRRGREEKPGLEGGLPGGAGEKAREIASRTEHKFGAGYESVNLYLEVTGQGVSGGAEALGWDGEGKPEDFILNYQKDWVGKSRGGVEDPE